jgi:hypothetical protein
MDKKIFFFAIKEDNMKYIGPHDPELRVCRKCALKAHAVGRRLFFIYEESTQCFFPEVTSRSIALFKENCAHRFFAGTFCLMTVIKLIWDIRPRGLGEITGCLF